jgi:hypothetical protein
MIAAASASGHQFDLGVDQTIEGQSNAFGSIADTVADGTYRLRPRANLSGDFGDLGTGRYSMTYRPSYVGYFRSDGVNGLDQAADGVASFNLTPRDRLGANAGYAEFRSIRALSQVNPDGSSDFVASTEGSTERGLVGLSYSRTLNARSNLGLNFDFQDYSYPGSNNVGNKSVGFTTSYTRALNRKFRLGGSLVARHRMFEAQPRVGSSSVTIVNVNLLGSYAISRTLEVEFEGGPTTIRTQPGRVQGLPEPGSATDTTYFMDIALKRSFKKANWQARYRRNEDPSAGTSRTSVNDTVSLSMNLTPNEFWGLVGRLGWSRRTTVDNVLFIDGTTGLIVPVTRDFRLDQVWTSLEATRRLDDRVLLSMRFRYQRWVENLIDGLSQPKQDNISGSITLNYHFDPYVF